MVSAKVLRQWHCNGGCKSKASSWLNPVVKSLLVSMDHFGNHLNNSENCPSYFSSGCLSNSSSIHCCKSVFVVVIDKLRTDAKFCSSVLFFDPSDPEKTICAPIVVH